MDNTGGHTKPSAAAIVIETVLALVISAGIYIQYINIESASGFGSIEYGISAVLGAIVGVLLGYRNTTSETVGLRYGLLVILFALGLGPILFPNGLPTTVFMGLLGAIWGSVGVKVVLANLADGNS